MLRIICLVCVVILISSCEILPGMQNPNTSNMPTVLTPPINVRPILIPITPYLLEDQSISTYSYRVAPSDVLAIYVWQHPEFNGTEGASPNFATAASTQGAAGQVGYLVNPNGKIYFPLVGYVRVAGKTIDTVRANIALRLRRYIRRPQVTVRVSDYRGQKVYVFGEIMRPGFLPINDQPLSIADALSLVGGIDNTSADPSRIYVIRGSFVEPRIYWLNARTPEAMLLAERFRLQPYDILFVSSATVTQWNRVLNQLLPTLQAIWYTKAITTHNG